MRVRFGANLTVWLAVFIFSVVGKDGVAYACSGVVPTFKGGDRLTFLSRLGNC